MKASHAEWCLRPAFLIRWPDPCGYGSARPFALHPITTIAECNAMRHGADSKLESAKQSRSFPVMLPHKASPGTISRTAY